MGFLNSFRLRTRNVEGAEILGADLEPREISGNKLAPVCIRVMAICVPLDHITPGEGPSRSDSRISADVGSKNVETVGSV